MRTLSFLTFAIIMISFGFSIPTESTQQSLGKKKKYRAPKIEGFPVDNNRPLVVFSSGYSSCLGGDRVFGSTFAIRFKEVVSEFKKIHGRDLDFVATCYIGMQSKKITFVSNRSDLVHKTHWKDHKPLIHYIKSFRTKNIYFYGHSYGGWLAMKLSQHFEATKLMTIDPISPAKCWIFTVATKGLLSSNCKVFPGDISRVEKMVISKRSNWKHFYQDDGVYVHSGPVFKEGGNEYLNKYFPRTERNIDDFSELDNLNDYVYGGEHGSISLLKEAWEPLYHFLNIGEPNPTVPVESLPNYK